MVEKGVGTYQKVSFLTADPKKLILICYRQAILNLKAAREHFLAKDMRQKQDPCKRRSTLSVS